MQCRRFGSSRRVAVRLLSTGVTVTLLTAGLGAATVRPVAAMPTSNSCFPALDGTLTPGAFAATTTGRGVGDVAIETPTGPSSEGTGTLSWSAGQSVTGNAGNQASSQTGTLAFTVALGARSITFASSCILEAGVFAGETEDDPFQPETSHVVLRGIEGEWIGTAKNFPGVGDATQVVASLAAWTTDVGPRFHLDVTTATFSPGQCPDENDNSGSISAAGPTAPNSAVGVKAPIQQAGRGACAD